MFDLWQLAGLGMWRSGKVRGVITVATAVLLAVRFGGGTVSAEQPARADFAWFKSHLPSSGTPFCAGECAVHVYGGVFTTTGMLSMFGLENLTTFRPEDFVPPWDWEFSRGGIIAGAASRRLVTFVEVIDLEGEIGIAQRFGNMHETEVWASLYARWTWFPWNRYVRTTVAASTGFNFASSVPELERERDKTHRGSKLLHFFSPEITLGLPAYPEWELVGRIHHRSGARVLVGEVDMFNGVGGGVHFATFGIRYRF